MTENKKKENRWKERERKRRQRAAKKKENNGGLPPLSIEWKEQIRRNNICTIYKTRRRTI